MHINDFVLKDLTPGALLSEFAPEITRFEFEQVRRDALSAVTESLNTQILNGRKKFISQELALQNFMKSFFTYRGLNDYYKRLAEAYPVGNF